MVGGELRVQMGINERAGGSQFAFITTTEERMKAPSHGGLLLGARLVSCTSSTHHHQCGGPLSSLQ